MERSKAGAKEKRSPDGQGYPNENNNKHNLLVLHKIWKNFNEMQLTKNKIDLTNRKMKEGRHRNDAYL